jgi:DNA-directed RNA polymerase alpha subunit
MTKMEMTGSKRFLYSPALFEKKKGTYANHLLIPTGVNIHTQTHVICCCARGGDNVLPLRVYFYDVVAP